MIMSTFFLTDVWTGEARFGSNRITDMHATWHSDQMLCISFGPTIDKTEHHIYVYMCLIAIIYDIYIAWLQKKVYPPYSDIDSEVTASQRSGLTLILMRAHTHTIIIIIKNDQSVLVYLCVSALTRLLQPVVNWADPLKDCALPAG